MEKTVRLYHWLPRIISILVILLTSIIAIDSNQVTLGVWQQLGNSAINLIPAFAFSTFLIIAWRWELIGGILFTVIGLMLSPYIFIHNYNTELSFLGSLVSIFTLILPFILIGILFIVSFFQKKKHHFF